jgi:hypothetical protein
MARGQVDLIDPDGIDIQIQQPRQDLGIHVVEIGIGQQVLAGVGRQRHAADDESLIPDLLPRLRWDVANPDRDGLKGSVVRSSALSETVVTVYPLPRFAKEPRSDAYGTELA